MQITIRGQTPRMIMPRLENLLDRYKAKRERERGALFLRGIIGSLVSIVPNGRLECGSTLKGQQMWQKHLRPPLRFLMRNMAIDDESVKESVTAVYETRVAMPGVYY